MSAEIRRSSAADTTQEATVSDTFQQQPATAQPHHQPTPPQPDFLTPAAPITPVVAQTVEHIALPGVGVVRLASLGSRAGARILDYVVVVVAYWVLAAVGFAGMIGAANAGGMTDESVFGSLGAFVGFLLLLGVLNVCYEAGMTAWKGATVGKMIMSIRVASTRTGGKPSVGGSVVRWVLPLVGSLFFGFGQLLVLLSPLFDGTGRRQGWHDRMASTVVVRSR